MEPIYNLLFTRFEQDAKNCLIMDLTKFKSSLNNVIESLTSYSIHMHYIRKTIYQNQYSSNLPAFNFSFLNLKTLLLPHMSESDYDRVCDFSFDASPFLLICFFNFAVGFLRMFSETPDNEDLYKRNRRGENGLHIASNLGHGRIVRFMLATESPLIHQTDYDGNLPFHSAILSNRVEIVQEYISYYYANNKMDLIEAPDKNGKRPIEVAAARDFKVLFYVFYMVGCRSDNYSDEYIQDSLFQYKTYKRINEENKQNKQNNIINNNKQWQ